MGQRRLRPYNGESNRTRHFVGWLTHVSANALFVCNLFYLGSESGPYALRVVSWYMNFDVLYAPLGWRHRRCEREQLARRATVQPTAMSFLSRIPNLIPSTPSSAPQEAMIASQKADINELVQKTRMLDDTIQHLQEQLTNSGAQWQAEHREWTDGCDSLMACHRIAHLRTNVRLAQERVALAHERDITRRERVAVIQRDYNLILFKAREKELEIEADHLREELRGATHGNVALVAQLRNKLVEGMRELKEKATLLRDAEKAREEAEVSLLTLPRPHAHILLFFCSGTGHPYAHRTRCLAGSAFNYSHKYREAYVAPRGCSDGSYREGTTEQRSPAGKGCSQSAGWEMEVNR
jgi:hypothetical protein